LNPAGIAALMNIFHCAQCKTGFTSHTSAYNDATGCCGMVRCDKENPIPTTIGCGYNSRYDGDNYVFVNPITNKPTTSFMNSDDLCDVCITQLLAAKKLRYWDGHRLFMCSKCQCDLTWPNVYWPFITPFRNTMFGSELQRSNYFGFNDKIFNNYFGEPSPSYITLPNSSIFIMFMTGAQKLMTDEPFDMWCGETVDDTQTIICVGNGVSYSWMQNSDTGDRLCTTCVNNALQDGILIDINTFLTTFNVQIIDADMAQLRIKMLKYRIKLLETQNEYFELKKACVSPAPSWVDVCRGVKPDKPDKSDNDHHNRNILLLPKAYKQLRSCEEHINILTKHKQLIKELKCFDKYELKKLCL
jgi:hypothetical protein